MTNERVVSVCSLELKVPDLEQALAFYTEVWGLSTVHREAGSVYLRAGGTEHHALVLRSNDAEASIAINFSAANRASVLALHDAVLKHAGKPLTAPAEFRSPGGGYGFSFQDPEGRLVRIKTDVARHTDAPDVSERPRKISHIVLNTANVAGASAFYKDALGFRLSDQTPGMTFLRCNTDHHSIAFAKDTAVGFNHVAWEMPSWNTLMFAAGRLKSKGYAPEWGLGRHGPGNNVFTYYVDPAGFAIEYTAEVEQIDEATHRPTRPEDWPRRENLDRWNFAAHPSARLLQAMHSGADKH